MSPRRVGILGGMGPEATVLLMEKIIAAVRAGDDADHVPLIVDQNPQVPSRIRHLIEGTGEDPAPILAAMARRLRAAGAEALAMPCNTAHHYAPAIRVAAGVPFLDMVALSVARAKALAGDGGTVGLLASPAVRRVGLFDEPLAAAGLKAAYPPDEAALLGAIRAIKADGPGDAAREALAQASAALLDQGAQVQMIACTEFSLIADAVAPGAAAFDTLDVLVEAVVEFALDQGAPTKQEPTSSSSYENKGGRKMRRSVNILIGTSALALIGGMAGAQEVVIGHFGNPTPMQVARAEGKFEAATGWDIEWRQFASGAEVIAAMASGDIKISELGSSPLAIAASQGVDLQLFMLAQVIGEAESLIAREGSGIETIEDLAGKRIAVPVGSTAHFSLMGVLDHAGIDPGDVTILNMPPDQIAAAWEQDAIDAAFIWQPVQSQIRQSGELLVGADQSAEWGYPTFDGWVVASDFAAENAEAVAAFAQAMDEANAAYLADPAAWTADSAPVQTIASQTGAAPEQVPEILKGFAFIPLDEQVGETWLGSAPATMQATAEFLQEAGRIDSAAEDYTPFVNTDIARAAAAE